MRLSSVFTQTHTKGSKRSNLRQAPYPVAGTQHCTGAPILRLHVGFSRSAAHRTLAMTFEGQRFCPLLITNNAPAGFKPREGHSTQMHLLSSVFYSFFSFPPNCPVFIPAPTTQNKCLHIAQVGHGCFYTSPSFSTFKTLAWRPFMPCVENKHCRHFLFFLFFAAAATEEGEGGFLSASLDFINPIKLHISISPTL